MRSDEREKRNRKRLNEIERLLENLDHYCRACRSLEQAGRPRSGGTGRKAREELLSICSYAEEDAREIVDLLEKIRSSWKAPEDDQAEKKHPGRERCDRLRAIRRKIAEANNVDFHPDECHHRGPCSGTCPACEAEVRYLAKQLEDKRKRGEEVFLDGIAKLEKEGE